MTLPATAFIHDFRQAAPYIQYLRGKTVILAISSQVLLADRLPTLVQDIQLLAHLGMHLVLVHGTRHYLDRMLQQSGRELRYHRGRRITDDAALALVKQACGLVRFDIEAALSATPAQTPDRRNRRLRIASGNFLLAKPLGVLDGVDMQHTGNIRRVDHEAIRQRLNDGDVVLVSPLGQSLSGKSFNLGLDETAAALALSLQADKLIFLSSEDGVADAQGHIISELTSAQAAELLAHGHYSSDMTRMLKTAVHVLENGVRRAHILSGMADGSLLAELFTRQGCGTMLAQAPFMRIRPADHRDIGDIIRLIEPLEAAGVLLPRSREYLEAHIQTFSVLEHDCHVYGCVALKHFADRGCAELACLAVSPDARDGGFGEYLLEHVIERARQKGAHTLFALSTRTGEWFDERGFTRAELTELPPERQQQYRANKRASQIYKLDLDALGQPIMAQPVPSASL